MIIKKRKRNTQFIRPGKKQKTQDNGDQKSDSTVPPSLQPLPPRGSSSIGGVNQLKTASTKATSNSILDAKTINNETSTLSTDAGATAENLLYSDKTSSASSSRPKKFSSAHSHIRSSSYIEFNPGICADFQKYGYCGFGDTCIYAHIREDYGSSYEMDKLWTERQKEKLNPKNDSKEDSKLPENCPICEKEFDEQSSVVKTHCGHYFCHNCILARFQKGKKKCPQCSSRLDGIFNIDSKFIKRLNEQREAKERSKDQDDDSSSDDKEDEKPLYGWSIPQVSLP